SRKRTLAMSFPGTVVRSSEKRHSRQRAKETKRFAIITQVCINFWLANTSIVNWKQKATATRLETARNRRLWRLFAKTSGRAINSHLKPKVNPRYFTTFATVGWSMV